MIYVINVTDVQSCCEEMFCVFTVTLHLNRHDAKFLHLGCKCDLSCSCGTLPLWLSSRDKTLELRIVSFINSYICGLTSVFQGIQNPFKAKKGRWNLTWLQPGSAFRYITSYFFDFLFFLSTIYFNLELLVNEDLSLNSVRRGRTMFCMVCFYLSLVGGRHYYISMKFFTDSVKLHP